MAVNLSEEREKQLEAERKRLSAAVTKKSYADSDNSLAAERSRLFQKIEQKKLDDANKKTAAIQSVRDNMLLNPRDVIKSDAVKTPSVTPAKPSVPYTDPRIVPVKPYVAPTPNVSTAPTIKLAVAGANRNSAVEAEQFKKPITVAEINRNAQQAKAEVAELIKKRNTPSPAAKTAKVTVADVNRNGDENKKLGEMSGEVFNLQKDIDADKAALNRININAQSRMPEILKLRETIKEKESLVQEKRTGIYNIEQNRQRETLESVKKNTDFEKTASSIDPSAIELKPLDKDFIIKQQAKRALYVNYADPVGMQTRDSVNDDNNNVYYMTDDQKKVLSYYVGKNDWDSADKYLKSISTILNEAKAKAYTAETVEREASGALGKVANVALNVIGSLKATTAYGDLFAKTVKEAATGKYQPIDLNSAAYQGVNMSRDTAEALSKDAYDAVYKGTGSAFWADTASNGVQIGLSVLQNAARLPAAMVMQPASLLMMGMGAAGQTGAEAIKSGGTKAQALTLATAAGLVEYITEKISLDNLFDLIEGAGKKAAKNVIQTAFQKQLAKITASTGFRLAKTLAVETSEEIAAELANNVLDSFVMGDKSQYNQYVKYLKNNAGYSEADARKAATHQFYVKNIIWAGIGGFASGGIMGGTGMAIGRLADNAKRAEAARIVAQAHGIKEAQKTTPAAPTEPVPATGTPVTSPTTPTAAQPVPAAQDSNVPTKRTPADITPVLTNMRDAYSAGDTEVGDLMYEAAIKTLKEESDDIRNDKTITVEQKKPLIDGYKKQIEDITAERDILSTKPVAKTEPEAEKPVEPAAVVPAPKSEEVSEKPAPEAIAPQSEAEAPKTEPVISKQTDAEIAAETDTQKPEVIPPAAEAKQPEATPEPAKKFTVPESATVVKDGNRFIVKNKVTLQDNIFKRFRKLMEEAGGKYDSTVRAFVFDKNPMDLFEVDNLEDRTADDWKPTITGKITIDEAPVTVYNSDIDGKSVFVIKASKYVGKEKFGTLRSKMESIGGVYDSRIQGFTFTTDPSEYLEASDTVTNNIGKAETVTKTAETVSKPEEIVSKAQETVAKEPEAKQPETEKAPVKAVENTPVEAKSEEAKPEPVKPPAETKDATAAEPKEDNPVTKSGKPTSKALSATGVDSKLVTLYAKNKKDVYNFARDGKEYVINDIILLRANPETISKISEERKRKGFTAIKKNDAIIEGFFKTIEKSSTSIKPEDATLDTLTLYGKTTELVKISAGTKNIYYDPDYLKYLALRADEISVDTKPEKVNIIMARDSEGTVGFMLPVRTPPADTVTAKTAPYDVGWFNQSKTVKPKTEEVTNVKSTDTKPAILEGQSAPNDRGIQSEAPEEVKAGGDTGGNADISGDKRGGTRGQDAEPPVRNELRTDTVSDGGPDTGSSIDGDAEQSDNIEGNDGTDVVSEIKPVKKKDKPKNKNNYSFAEDEAFGNTLDNSRPNIYDNFKIIKLLKEIESSDRKATQEEKAILARYKGWGGLKDAFNGQGQLKTMLTSAEYKAANATILNAHYTSTKIVKSMYDMLDRLGFKGGSVLEPSAGVGVFYGMMPKKMALKSDLYGVEFDSITGRIAKILYPDAKIEIKPYQDVKYNDGVFDVAIGNVPFFESSNAYKGGKYTLHDYFFVKSLDKVRDGGLVMFLTSTGTLDKINPNARLAIAERANLVAAFRLPNNAFKINAGAQVTTDLLIFQKRPDGVEQNAETFEKLGMINNIPVNEYYARHPGNILGELVYEKDGFGKDRAQVNPASGDFATVLSDAVKLLPRNIIDADLNVQDVTVINESSKPRFAIQNNKVYFTPGGKSKPELITGRAADRVKRYLDIKNAYNNLYDITVNPDTTEEQKAAARAELGKVYDNFVGDATTKNVRTGTDFGALALPKNMRELKRDGDFWKISGLERFVPSKAKGVPGKYIKADVFTRDTITKKKPESASNATDALAISLYENGNVDLKYMAKLTNISEEKLIEDLKGQIIETPDGELQLMPVYLSGNIREKLDEAKKAAETDSRYSENVKYLEQAMPADKPPSDITPTLGASWIPPKYIERFTQEAMGCREPKISYDPSTGSWMVQPNIYAQKWNTGRAQAGELLDSALNMRTVTVRDKDSKGNTFINEDATRAARAKVDDIKNEFNSWIFKDKTRREELAIIYNDKLNNHRNMDYEELSKYLQLQGLENFVPRDYQKRGAARVVFGGSTLLAHGVGTGKTAVTIMAAMEMKRMGIANKNMFVVPNHKVGDFRNDIVTMYPNARVLMPTSADFKKENRAKLFAQIATNDWDAVIVGHNQFGMIPMSQQSQQEYLDREIEEIERIIEEYRIENGDKIDKKFIADLEKAKQNAKNKIDDLLKKGGVDETLTFEEMGVDSLIVDEAHNFKNLRFYTKMDVAGASGSASGRAEKMFMKTTYLHSRKGRVIFATATPITNSVSEIYNMSRFVAPEALKEAGLQSFDAWASTFGQIITKIEQSPDGSSFRTKERFAKFHNVQEMVGLFRQFADVLKTKDVITELPKAELVTVESPASDIHQKFLDNIKVRVGNMTRQDRTDNMLLVTNDGRAMATDLRLVASQIGKSIKELDVPDSKINNCVRSVYKEYKESEAIKGTQFVFLDFGMADPKPGKDGKWPRYGFNLYTNLTKKLIAEGIPANEIANIANYKSVTAKIELFRQVNAGEVRVLLGSTARMGEGMNAQERAVAIHHLNPPYRPSDIEQRNGRIVRFGNMNKDVREYRYVQVRSFDSYMWQMLSRKAEFVNQAMSDGTTNEMEEVDEFVLSANELMAIASDNPLLMEKATLDDKINTLRARRKNYERDQWTAQSTLEKAPKEIRKHEAYIKNVEADVKTIESNPFTQDGFEMTVLGKKYTKQKEAGAAILKATKDEKYQLDTEYSIGKLRGMTVGFKMVTPSFGYIYLTGNNSYGNYISDSDVGNVQKLINETGRIPGYITEAKGKIEQEQFNLNDARETLTKPFADQAELDATRNRLNQIDTELNLSNNKQEAIIDSDSMQDDFKSEEEEIAEEEEATEVEVTDDSADGTATTDTAPTETPRFEAGGYYPHYSATGDTLRTDDKYFSDLVANLATPRGISVVIDDDIDGGGEVMYSAKDLPQPTRPTLKTLAGSAIQRYNNSVGKAMGNQIYVHKNYADEIVPADVWDKAKKLVGDFKYNAIMYDIKKHDIVRFDSAPTFDTEREPYPGEFIEVNIKTGETRTGANYNIWHHKWNWVKDDYKGFDVNDSYNWSKNWLKNITNPSGSYRAWRSLLVENELATDPIRESTDMARDVKYGDVGKRDEFIGLKPWGDAQQKVTSAITSVNKDRLPQLLGDKNFQTEVRNLVKKNGTVVIADLGGGKYDNAKQYYESIEFLNGKDYDHAAYAASGGKLYHKDSENRVSFLVYDRWNRTDEYNKETIAKIRGGKADIVTINNVTNVIAAPDDELRAGKVTGEVNEPTVKYDIKEDKKIGSAADSGYSVISSGSRVARGQLYLNAADAIKPDGAVYIAPWTGKADSIMRPDKKRDSVQLHRTPEAYINETQRFFDEVTQPNLYKYNTLVARMPVKDATQIQYSAGKAISAYYDRNLKQIHISKDALKSNTILLGHELFHSISEADQAKIAYFFRQNTDTSTEAWKKFKADRTATYTKLYAKNGRTFTEKDFWQEYAAENCETLFTDETYIKRLAGKSKGLVQKILDFIRDLWHRFIMHDTFKYSRASTDGGVTYDTLIKAEKMYSDALGVKSHNLTVPEAAQADVSDNYGYGETAEAYSAGENRDATYMDAVNRGDTNTAQKMVDEAAKKAFPNSVIRDSNGNLIKAYHGTRAQFNVFRGKEGSYFTPWKKIAEQYGSNVRAFYLNIEKPVEYDEDFNVMNDTEEDDADGTIYIGEDMRSGIDQNRVGDTEFIVYDPNRIKSADAITYDDSGNVIPLSQRFDAGSNNINYSATETAEAEPEAEDRPDEEVADFYKGDYQPLATHTAIEMIKGSTEWSWQRISRTIPDIPESGDNGTFFAMFRNAIIRFRSAAPRASAKAGQLMDEMVSIKGADGKTTPLNPEDFETFQKAVYYYDLREEAKIQRTAEPDKVPVLPHNMTESEVQKQIDRLDINKNVTAALNKRSAIWNGIVSKYITYNKDVGWDVSGRFSRENYYHHQVIDFMDQSKNKNIRFNRRNGTVEINTGRGWVRHRGGSERATNTNFITVEYLVLQQMLYDTEVAKMLSDTKQRYDIKPQLVAQAKNMNKAAVDSIIIGEAKGAAVRAAETSLGRKLTADEIENIEPQYTTRGLKQIPTSPTYDAINVFNKRMAMSADTLHRMAAKDEFEDVPAQFRNAVEKLKRDEMGPEVFAFMSYLASSVEVEEQAKISALTFLSNVAKKERFIRNLLGKDYETWETLLDKTEGFSKIQPRSGQFQYTKEVVADDKIGKMFNDTVAEIVKGNKFISDEAKDAIIAQYTEQIKVMGMPYETWVVPDVVRIVLGKEAAKKDVIIPAILSRSALSAWKGWVTAINPYRTVKFAKRNFLGDLDAVIAGNPGIVKYIPQAFGDIFNATQKNERSANFSEWAELGGMMNLIHAQEIDTGSIKKVFKIITDKPDTAWDVIKGIPGKYVNGVQNLQEFRESILRYSAYLFYKEKVMSNRKITDYVSSNRNIVRGLDTPQLKAYQLSKDLLGAYDEVSAMGHTIRRHLIPFYSFVETNFKRYYRLFVNPIVNIVEELKTNDSAGEKAKSISKDAANLLKKIARANALMVVMFLVNRVLNPDDDDKLPEDVRARPHFTYGHIGDTVIAFTRIGNISELLEWVGLDDLEWTPDDINAPFDKIYGSITPFIKTPFEIRAGITYYPEMAHPRAIRDKWLYFFNTLGLADVYNAVTGKPSAKGFLDTLAGTVVYSYDYKTAAYWDIMGAKGEYQDKADMLTTNPTRKQNALYYMKQAIRYGEQDKAEKYLDEYFEEGGNGRGIATSIAMMNPLYGFLSEETYEKGKAFVKSLDDAMTEKLYVAYDYYEKYLEIPPELATLLRKDSTTEAQAKMMLKSYIKKVTAMANKK